MVAKKYLLFLAVSFVLSATLASNALAACVAARETKPNIIEVAKTATNFTTLLKALETAGLVNVLKSEGPFTVFAPIDEAFAKIPEEELKALLEDKEKLKAVLTYHVVAGKVLLKDMKDGLQLKTLQGNPVIFYVRGDTIRVNEAKIIATDIEAKNGVIHIIDTVIVPGACPPSP
ncbi:MAG: fasciclin domain-containing protein [Candidatus Caldatribacterium sp.]|uniref:fasciclin domain-containing protein n=1 Tax=Candidatus Caldatribacterium sp. TaxID=2282143 RepID=UPI002996FD81|nr:fasciclin domain-containing protein [Candidatus Caldatribacterium sp.]MCX7729850.1 fasciclin domain-containing protein [Candidatus Caldatribacterium sp.]MDW8081289.1 fasciclin domain-containing protein [Candidatus Calescibacterium sp.]